MSTAWIYQLHKPELVKEAEDRGIPTEGLTVDRIRKLLAEAVKASEESTTPDKPQPVAMEEDQGKGETNRLNKLIEEWDLSYRMDDNPVEFIERLEELVAVSGIDKEDVLPALPRILQGKALLWHRNNAESWESWEEFLELFKLYYFPANYEEDLIVKIVARKQKFRESFTDYLTDLQTLMRRYGNLTDKEKLHRIHENMQKGYKLYIKRQDYKNLAGLIKLAAEYECITASPDHDRYSSDGDTKLHEPGRQERTIHISRKEDLPTGKDRTGRDKTAKIHSRYNAKTCCWSCGKPGHNTRECTAQRQIFCSGCGRIGVLSRNCCKSENAGKRESLGTAGDHSRDDNRIYENAKIAGNTYSCIIDTGSTNTYINEQVYEACKVQGVPEKQTQKSVVLANGSQTKINTSILVEMELKDMRIKHWVRVLPSATRTIIGMDVLRRAGMTIKWAGETQTPEGTHGTQSRLDPIYTEYVGKTQENERPPCGNGNTRNTQQLTERAPIKKNPVTRQKAESRTQRQTAEQEIRDTPNNDTRPVEYCAILQPAKPVLLYGREPRNPNDENPFPTPQEKEKPADRGLAKNLRYRNNITTSQRKIHRAQIRIRSIVKQTTTDRLTATRANKQNDEGKLSDTKGNLNKKNIRLNFSVTRLPPDKWPPPRREADGERPQRKKGLG